MRADSQVALRAVGTPAKVTLKVLAGYYARARCSKHCDVARYPVLVVRGRVRPSICGARWDPRPGPEKCANLAQAQVRVHRHGVPRTEDEA